MLHLIFNVMFDRHIMVLCRVQLTSIVTTRPTQLLSIDCVLSTLVSCWFLAQYGRIGAWKCLPGGPGVCPVGGWVCRTAPHFVAG